MQDNLLDAEGRFINNDCIGHCLGMDDRQVERKLHHGNHNRRTPIDAERERETAEARAALLRHAEALGIKPITSFEDLAGDPEMTADFDVDEFLRQVREDRDRPSTRSIE
jgi:hypothetical protein